METKPGPDTDPAARGVRPRSVDLAVGAILLRCVLALAAAFALFGARDELRRDGAKLHPEWSAATLADKIDSELRSNVVLTVLYIGLVLLIAKFLRDGRNWARWLYAFIAFLVAGDVLRVAGFFTSGNVLFRLLSGLTGVAAVVAIVLLFSPSASAYFRRAGSASSSPLRVLFGGRAAMADPGTAAARDGRPATRDTEPAARNTEPATRDTEPASRAPVSLDKGARRATTAATGPASVARPSGGRGAPRAKSRKQATE